MLTIKKDSLKYRDPNTGQFATVGMLETTVYTDGVLPVDPVEVDKTLTVEGAAADAKATGDALNTKLSEDQVREVIDEVLEQAKESGEFNGEPGQSFVILGVHSTEEELKQKVTSPKQGDHYNVGPNAEGEYNLYMYDANKGWINKGSANGGTGASGTIIDFGDDLPQALGVASAGVSNTATRSDHVHPMPTAKDVGALFIDATGSEAGPPTPINADTLGGIPASNYAHKTDIPNSVTSITIGETTYQPTQNGKLELPEDLGGGGKGVPDGGSAGQTLVKQSNTDGDVIWQTLTANDIGAVSANVDDSIPETNIVVLANADLLSGMNYAQIKEDIIDSMPDISNNLSVNEDGKITQGNNIIPVDATTFNGMTWDQLKEAILNEAVYL